MAVNLYTTPITAVGFAGWVKNAPGSVGAWLASFFSGAYSRSFGAQASGGTAGQTVTLEFHSWFDTTDAAVAGDAATLVGTLTLTIGSAYSGGTITAKGKVPDLIALPWDYVGVYCTQIGTGGITAYPMMGGV